MLELSLPSAKPWWVPGSCWHPACRPMPCPGTTGLARSGWDRGEGGTPAWWPAPAAGPRRQQWGGWEGQGGAAQPAEQRLLMGVVAKWRPLGPAQPCRPPRDEHHARTHLPPVGLTVVLPTLLVGGLHSAAGCGYVFVSEL